MKKILLLLFLTFLFLPLNSLAQEEKVIYTDCSWVKFRTNSFDPGVSITYSCSSMGMVSMPGKCDPKSRPSQWFFNGIIECCCSIEREEIANKKDFITPKLPILSGIIKLSELDCKKDDAFCNIPWIAEFVKGVYNYGIGVGGILAAIMLMAGGIIWLVSGGDSSKVGQAKKVISGSIIGMLLLFGSYLILDTINPELKFLKPISLDLIQPDNLMSIIAENGSDSEENNAGNCAEDETMQNIDTISGLKTSASDPRLTVKGYQALEKANEIAKSHGVGLHVTSAFRSNETQKELWKEAEKKYGDQASKYVAKPNSCGGHRNGQTVDLCLTRNGAPTESCSKIKPAYANYSDPDIELLKKIMKEAGWVRYAGEWWHYQYEYPPKNPAND